MKPMNANELLAGLALARPVPITAVVTDSRKVQPGCIFVCFPGERVDGHDYAAKAYQAGAEYVIANHPVEGVPEDHLVICESSYLAMIRMASNYRTLFSPLMIGVTGSVGKTTTKEFCYAVLSAFGKICNTVNHRTDPSPFLHLRYINSQNQHQSNRRQSGSQGHRQQPPAHPGYHKQDKTYCPDQSRGREIIHKNQQNHRSHKKQKLL